MYVQRIHLSHVCGIDELTLDLTERQQDRRCTVLIGQNGTGKSTVLRAVALGLASESDAIALLAEPFGSPFVSTDHSHGTIKLTLVDQHGVVSYRKVNITKGTPDNNEKIRFAQGHEDALPHPLVVAFGAGRSNEGAESSQGTHADSTYMLFNYEGTFIPTELTLRRLQDFQDESWYDSVLLRIKNALGLDQSHELKVERGGGVVVSGPYPGSSIPLASWADGYRVTLSWILDVYAWAMRYKGAIDLDGHVNGILLVDEIEQHLHPSMQRGIVESLKRLFPRMQILVTSHSPHVLQGATTDEIIALHRDGASVQAASLGDYSGYSVEDLLTAIELFSTAPYSLHIEDLRSEYAALIRKQARSKDEDQRLSSIGRELANLRIPSSDRRSERFAD